MVSSTSPPNYKAFFEEALADASKELIGKALEKKLQDQGIDPETFPLAELAEHLLSGSDEPFTHESDLGDADLNVTLSFTEEEDEKLASDLQDLWDRSGEIFLRATEVAAEESLRALSKEWPELYSDDAAYLYRFKLRLQHRWGRAIDLFRMMVHCAAEVLDDSAAAFMRSRAKKGLTLKEVLFGIQARTLRTSAAVAVLLDHGLADEAYARWRTLHELNVVGTFIADKGEDAAVRYRDHEAVDLRKRLKLEQEWGSKWVTPRVRRKILRDYGKVVSKYGKGFKVDYGWASPYLKTKKGTNERPTFAQLEQEVYGLAKDDRVPPYRESSHQVHPGRSGLMGLSSSALQIAAGYSNKGLEIPLMNSACSLAKTTILVLQSNWRKDPVLMQFFLTLEGKIEAEARRAARRLRRDDTKIRLEEKSRR